jgi:putative transposase
MTFVRNHASALIACDFAMVVTAHFRVLYVFVVLEVSTRRILHYNGHLSPDSPVDGATVP